jgi:Domain of unknown function (DUF4424)
MGIIMTSNTKKILFRACLIFGIVVTVSFITPQSTRAYDGVVRNQLQATGLQIAQNNDITEKSTQIIMTRSLIKMSYRLVNVGHKDIGSYLYFRLPTIPSNHGGNSTAYAQPLGNNPLRFKVTVNGAPIDHETSQYALHQGLDVTQTVKASGLPLAPFGDDLMKGLKALSAKKKLHLLERGIVKHRGVAWQLQTTHFWRQNFPVGKEMNIEISYRPVYGQFVDSLIFIQDKISFGLEEPNYDFLCLSDKQKAQVKALFVALGTKEYVEPYTISHISFDLAKIRAWIASIANLNFTIKAKNKGDIISICGGDFKKTGPTEYEWKTKPSDHKRKMKIYFLELNEKG